MILFKKINLYHLVKAQFNTKTLTRCLSSSNHLVDMKGQWVFIENKPK